MADKFAKNILDRLPPQNLEAEKSVLGSLMLDKDAIIKIGDILRADDFYVDAHSKIYEAMVGLFEERTSIDILTVSNKLEEQGQLDKVGGTSALASLVNSVPTAAHVVHYANIISRKGTLRRLLNAANTITNLGYQETEDVASVLDKAEQELFAVSQKYLRKNFIPVTDLLTSTFDRIQQLHDNKGMVRGVPTGFTDLDNLLGGFQKSNLVIIAARPSMGKTSFVLDIARRAAVQDKTPIGIFSLEMSKEELVDRFVCAEADVDLWKMRTGNLSDQGEKNDFERIGDAIARLSESPIYIDDSAGSNIMEIRTKARRLQSEHGVGLLIVDYLQLLEGRSTENRVQEVSEISRALKSIARELDVPVIGVSQLSRAVELRTPQIPRLADLRESGSIEQDADVVMFIYREEMYKKDTDRKHIAEIHVEKHRNGPTGQVDLYFEAERASFKNLAKEAAGMSSAMASEIEF